jgi:glycosyltransferase involved in cell wall biosynthesis
MRVSVAMATYNGADYIIEQLDSIYRQTRAVDEVIICDDCSKDNTVTIVKEYIINASCRANGKLK